MATVTLTIPDALVQEVKDALADLDPNPKQAIIKMIKGRVIARRQFKAMNTLDEKVDVT